MKVTLREIIDAMQAMAQFAQEKLPAKAAYRVSKIARKMNAEHNEFVELRNAAIKKHGDKVSKDGEPEQYRVRNAAQAKEIDAELEPLLGEEVELEGCAKIAWADVEKLTLSPAVLSDLHAFIEEPPDEKPGLKAVA